MSTVRRCGGFVMISVSVSSKGWETIDHKALCILWNTIRLWLCQLDEYGSTLRASVG